MLKEARGSRAVASHSMRKGARDDTMTRRKRHDYPIKQKASKLTEGSCDQSQCHCDQRFRAVRIRKRSHRGKHRAILRQKFPRIICRHIQNSFTIRPAVVSQAVRSFAPAIWRKYLVPVERIELPTFGLQNRCSTAELNRHLVGSPLAYEYRHTNVLATLGEVMTTKRKAKNLAYRPNVMEGASSKPAIRIAFP